MGIYAKPNMNKIHKNKVYNIGSSDGEFSDGRPYVAERWYDDGFTMVSIYMSSENFNLGKNYTVNTEYDLYFGNTDAVSDILDYLITEDIISKDYIASDISILTVGEKEDKMVSINIVVAEEDEKYEQVGIQF